jgi:ubiquinone/menaquinone biosynthesis C-methylase UbiE
MPERHPYFAVVYDLLMIPQDWLGLRRQRERTAGVAAGRVLELGIGTGLNLPLYPAAASLVGVEPDPHMLVRARARARRLGRRVRLALASGDRLPFPDGSFDAVVATLVLCTIPDATAAAREVRRVLAPGGALHFLEHVRSTRPWLARLQDGIAPVWRRIAAGCHPNRATLAVLETAGFRLERLWRSGSGILVQGTARPAAADGEVARQTREPPPGTA